MNNSPFLLAKQLQFSVLNLLSGIDITDLNPSEQKVLARLKSGLVDVRLEVQDYELAETREFQLQNAKKAKEYLAAIEKTISDNVLNVFGPVDVAHLTAQIGQITDKIE